MSARRLMTTAAAVLSLALVVTACGSTSPSPTPATAAPATVTPTVSPTSSPTPVATPEATPSPSPTPEPTPSPTPTLTPTRTPVVSPSPSPSPAAVDKVIEDYVWTVSSPLVLRGAAGTTKWTRILFAARTVDLRWSATPETAKNCSLRYTLESKTLKSPVKGTIRTKGAKPASGSRSIAIKYGDGKLTVVSNCPKWSIKFVPTGHPGVKIVRKTEYDTAKGTTAAQLNDALMEAELDWGITSNITYYSGPVRVTAFSVTLKVTRELPKWKAPEGTDPELVKAWSTALAGMKRHLQGEEAIAVQAAGRYYEAAKAKTRFTSVSAMDRSYDKTWDRYSDAAGDRLDAYNEYTYYGMNQGAFIP